MLHAVIIAGGSGSRFWPQSRQSRPKQLLNLLGSQTMIQATVERVLPLVSMDRLQIATGSALAPAIAEQLPTLPASAMLVEPCRRDTAPCIGLAAMLVARNDPEATLAVLPADHVITPTEAFRRALEGAAKLVDASPESFVTFGVRPTYPAESFGYIEKGSAVDESPEGLRVFHAVRFREKPAAAVARQYVESGMFLWNAGIFVWRAATLLAELRRRHPAMVERLERIVAAAGSDEYEAVLEREFSAIERISIDYAVMEHAANVLVIEAPFEWDDLGSWQAVARQVGEDARGNTFIGVHLDLDSRGTIVHNPTEHLVVTLGLVDCLVVHTPDATLVANKHDEEAVRQLVKQLEERGWTKYL